jgi:4-hydroxy-3-methylbut-2-enyl diphosphate reductase
MANEEELNFSDLYENSLRKLEEGTVVQGTIINIIDDEIFVDLGYKADGIIPKDEFSYDDVKPSDMFKVGDTISAFILKMNNGQGNILLSYKKLQNKQIKEDFEKNVKENKPVDAKVIDVVNGGIIAQTAGIKIFVPQTQLANKDADLSLYRGKKLTLKIIEYNPAKRKIVGSERKVISEARSMQSQETLNNIEVGKEVDGVVKQLSDFGAFVDIGGIDGLLHVSEISWKQIKHPSEVLKVGDKIRVTILSFNKEEKKISLGLRKAEDNPWNNIKYQVGDIIEVKVVSMKPFGAFVELDNGLEGLVHISNITAKRISKPQDVLAIGQVVQAKIVEIDLNKKRIELSIRELEGATEEKVEESKEDNTQN